VLVHLLDPEFLDVVHFLCMFIWVDGEETSPPASPFGEPWESERFFECDFSFHFDGRLMVLGICVCRL
jgi:hypothetical protein